MSERAIRVDQLHLERLTASGTSLGVAAPLFAPPERPIAPYTIAEIYFKTALSGPAIRQLLRTTTRASNPYCSPRTELIVGGRLTILVPGSMTAFQRERTVRFPFNVAIRTPELNLTCPSAQT